jgi:uncharacterized protein (DUF305 family)
MCEKARIQDDAVRCLCKSIITSQQSEIVTMKAKLAELQQ